jgi:hypothetical protein
MDKKFGKFEVHKCWKNVAINYNRNPVVPPNANQTDEDDYDDIDENDL